MNNAARTHLLFLYGSLKRGMENESLMTEAEFVAPAKTTKACYRLKIMQSTVWPYPYPVLCEDGKGYISGEIFKVSDNMLQQLDEFEDCTNDYERRLIALAGHDTPIFTYFGRPFLIKNAKSEHPRLHFDEKTSIWNWT